MKKSGKMTALLLSLSLALVGCGGQEASQPASEESAVAATGDLVEGDYTIGINQFAQHGSLDNCREGFIQGLAEEGFVEGENLTIDYQNANAETATAGQIAENFVGKGVDLICAIATPSAMSSYTAAEGTDIPVIYSAVTDPVAAELAQEDGSPVGNITGTSDTLPVKAQLEMIRTMLPDAKTIGILYTTSEVNSLTTIQTYEELVGDYGFELETIGVSTTADIPMAADQILTKVDCITNLTDNTVVSSLPLILDKANDAGIPVFGSEIEQVRIGCLAAEGIEYVGLGEQTGRMAAQVLKGEKEASEMNFEVTEASLLYINQAVADNLGIEVPAELSDRATEVFDSIEVGQ